MERKPSPRHTILRPTGFQCRSRLHGAVLVGCLAALAACGGKTESGAKSEQKPVDAPGKSGPGPGAPQDAVPQGVGRFQLTFPSNVVDSVPFLKEALITIKGEKNFTQQFPVKAEDLHKKIEFQDVPSGNLVVKIEFIDMNGQLIMHSQGTAVIEAGKPSVANIGVRPIEDGSGDEKSFGGKGKEIVLTPQNPSPSMGGGSGARGLFPASLDKLTVSLQLQSNVDEAKKCPGEFFVLKNGVDFNHVKCEDPVEGDAPVRVTTRYRFMSQASGAAAQAIVKALVLKSDAAAPKATSECKPGWTQATVTIVRTYADDEHKALNAEFRAGAKAFLTKYPEWQANTNVVEQAISAKITGLPNELRRNVLGQLCGSEALGVVDVAAARKSADALLKHAKDNGAVVSFNKQ